MEYSRIRLKKRRRELSGARCLAFVFNGLFSIAALIGVFFYAVHPLAIVAGRLSPTVLIFFGAGVITGLSIIVTSSHSQSSKLLVWLYRICIGLIFIGIASTIIYIGLLIHPQNAWRVMAAVKFSLLGLVVFCCRLLYGRRIAFLTLGLSGLFLIVASVGGLNETMRSIVFQVLWLAILMLIGLQAVLLFMRGSTQTSKYLFYLRLATALILLGLYVINSVDLVYIVTPLLLIIAMYTPFWYSRTRVDDAQ